MENTQPININISKDKTTEIGEYNEFRDYIIKNNIELQREIKSNIQIIKNHEATITEKEAEEDKYDTRIRYMKGLLQNLNQIRELYSNIKIKSESKIEIIRDHNKKTKQIYYEIYGILIISNILTLITPFTLDYFNWFNLLLQIIYCGAVPYSINKIKDKYYTISTISKQSTDLMKQQTSEINQLKLEVKKIEESSISIDNWINEL